MCCVRCISLRCEGKAVQHKVKYRERFDNARICRRWGGWGCTRCARPQGCRPMRFALFFKISWQYGIFILTLVFWVDLSRNCLDKKERKEEKSDKSETGREKHGSVPAESSHFSLFKQNLYRLGEKVTCFGKEVTKSVTSKKIFLCSRASLSSEKSDKSDVWHFLSTKQVTKVTSPTQN